MELIFDWAKGVIAEHKFTIAIASAGTWDVAPAAVAERIPKTQRYNIML